jgi:hypothetical protein
VPPTSTVRDADAAGQARPAADPPGPPHADPPAQPPPGRRPRPGTARPPLPWGEVTVEVDNALCRNILWGPNQMTLRARWDWARVPRNLTSEKLAKMPNIPGLQIVVNTRDRLARIIDPLGFRDNQQLARQVFAVWEQAFQEKRCVVPTWERRGLSDDDVATWLYWLGRELEAKHVVLISGRVPPLPEIAEVLPGASIRLQFYDSLAYRRDQQQMSATKVLEEWEASWASAPPGATGTP